jgi:hypothetical protein
MKLLHALAAVACGAAMTACGGGGDGAGAATPVAGLYEGSGGSNRASELLILDTGRYYLVYGRISASATPVGGVIVGDGAASGNSFTSTNAHDFDLQSHTLLTGALTSTIAPKASASTTVVRSGGSGAAYAGTFNPVSDSPASLSALAASYAGELVDLSGTLASVLTIDASGVLAGTSGTCSYAGLAAPHGSGNVYDISINFRNACPNAGNTLKGHAFLSGKLLYLVVASGNLASVELFSGARP